MATATATTYAETQFGNPEDYGVVEQGQTEETEVEVCMKLM